MGGNYSDFSRPATGLQTTQLPGSNTTESARPTVKPSGTDPKTSDVSQQILAAVQHQTPTGKPLTALHVEPQPELLSEDGTPTSGAKTHSVGTPILAQEETPEEHGKMSHELLQADSQRRGIETHLNETETGSLSKLELISNMSEAELIEILQTDEEHLTDEEFDLIEQRMMEFKTQNTALQESVIEIGEQLHETSEAEAIAAITTNTTIAPEKMYILSKDGSFHEATLDELQSKKFDANSLASFENGILQTSAEMAKHFKVGDKIDGVEIKEIKILTKQQLAAMSAAFIAQNQITRPEEHQTHSETTFNPRAHSDHSTTNQTQQNATVQGRHDKVSTSQAQGSTGPSAKQINEKRIAKFIEAMEQKFARIKDEIKKEQIKHEELSRANLKSEIAQSEIKKEFTELSTQYKTLMNQLRQPSSPIEIPLQTLEKFQRFEVELERIIHLPIFKSTSKGTPEMMENTVALKKEVMDFITDMINISGNEVRVGSNAGKSAPAA